LEAALLALVVEAELVEDPVEVPVVWPAVLLLEPEEVPVAPVEAEEAPVVAPVAEVAAVVAPVEELPVEEPLLEVELEPEEALAERQLSAKSITQDKHFFLLVFMLGSTYNRAVQ
jgi:hypothetical protein